MSGKAVCGDAQHVQCLRTGKELSTWEAERKPRGFLLEQWREKSKLRSEQGPNLTGTL